MSIPLIQKPEKDDINTSIIAIKRNIERINMLLGLSNSEEIDTSEFVKKSDIVDEVAIDNMHSVSSNAVAKAMSYSTEEHFTGKYWIDGKKIYSKTIIYNHTANSASYFYAPLGITDNDFITEINYCTSLFSSNKFQFFDKSFWDIINNEDWFLYGFREGTRYYFRTGPAINGYTFFVYINIEYTKATD